MDRQEVVRELYLAHGAGLVASVYGLIGDYAEAQDVVHEAFARALTAPASFDELDNPNLWLRTVAVNLARSAARRRAVLGRLMRTGRLQTPSPVPGMSPDRVLVVAALQRVGRRLREVLVLHYLADLSVNEVAAILAISPSAVKARLQRGRRELAVLLADAELDHSQEAQHA